MTVLRVVLLVVIAFLLVGVVIAIARDDTGAVEKVALVAVAVLLLVAASQVRRRLA